jgi:type II secretory pathway pseudopilin PulG
MTNPSKQSGQTLIETLVASFILTMGIAAAVGLAIFSLGASTSIRQQLLAVGLAREGIEVVKGMRDTNWLKATLSNTCYNYGDGGSATASCYPNWLNATSSGGFDITPLLGGPTSYILRFNSADTMLWQLEQSTKFGLQLDATGSKGFYFAPAGGVDFIDPSNPPFARRVDLETVSTAPFDQVGPRLKVTSTVWWTDKNCPRINVPPLNGKCVIKLETYLTNWKNY